LSVDVGEDVQKGDDFGQEATYRGKDSSIIAVDDMG